MPAETILKPDSSEIKDSEKQAEKPAEKKSFKEKMGEMYLKWGGKVVEGITKTMEALSAIKEKVSGGKGLSAERLKEIQEIMVKEAAEKDKAESAVEDMKAISEQAEAAIESGNPQIIANEAGKLESGEQAVQTTENIAKNEKETPATTELVLKDIDAISTEDLDGADKKINSAYKKEYRNGEEVTIMNREGDERENEAFQESSDKFGKKMEKILQETNTLYQKALDDFEAKNGPDGLKTLMGHLPKDHMAEFSTMGIRMTKDSEKSQIEWLTRIPTEIKHFQSQAEFAVKKAELINSFLDRQLTTDEIKSFQDQEKKLREKRNYPYENKKIRGNKQ